MGDVNDLHVFLRDKARRENQTALPPQVDWETKKNEWIENVAGLYERVRTWLEPLEKENVLSYRTEPVTLQEEPIGSYEVDALTILIGKQRVVFQPKGTLIIGAEGRVDIRGLRAVRTLLCSDGLWSVVERAPRLKVLPFTEDSFQDILSEVME